MAIVDRRGVSVSSEDAVAYGVPNAGLAVKTACRVATTGNIALSGLQTIDGVALEAGNRVFVWQQTDATQNGPYNASTGNWTRTDDADSNDLWSSGMRIAIGDEGATYHAIEFQLTAADPIILDETELTFIGAGVNATGSFTRGDVPMASNSTGVLFEKSTVRVNDAGDMNATAGSISSAAPDSNFGAGAARASIDYTGSVARFGSVQGAAGVPKPATFGVDGDVYATANPTTKDLEVRNADIGLPHIARLRHLVADCGFTAASGVSDGTMAAIIAANDAAPLTKLLGYINAGKFVEMPQGFFPVTKIGTITSNHGGGLIGEGSGDWSLDPTGSVLAVNTVTDDIFTLSASRNVEFKRFTVLSLKHRTAGYDFYTTGRAEETSWDSVTSLGGYIPWRLGNSIYNKLKHCWLVNPIGRAGYLALGEAVAGSHCERVELFNCRNYVTWLGQDPSVSNTPGARQSSTLYAQYKILTVTLSGTSYIVQVGTAGTTGSGAAPALPTFTSAIARTTQFITDGTCQYRIVCRADLGMLVHDSATEYVDAIGGDYQGGLNGVQMLNTLTGAGNVPKHLSLSGGCLIDHTYGNGVSLLAGANVAIDETVRITASATGCGLEIGGSFSGPVTVAPGALIAGHAREAVTIASGPFGTSIAARMGGCGAANPANIDLFVAAAGASDWDICGAVLGGLPGYSDSHRYEGNIGAGCDRFSTAGAKVTFSGTPGGILNSSGTSGSKREFLSTPTNSASLVAIANAGAASADQSLNFTGPTAANFYTVTAFSKTVLDDTTSGVWRATLGLVIGTDVQAFNTRLAGIAGLASTANRLYGADGSGNATLVTMPAAGLTLSAGAIALANDLAAYEGLSATGMVARTADGSASARTITGTSNRTTITNGDGVSGNPTVDISTSYVGQATITTVGTIGTGVWNAGAVTSSGAITGASAAITNLASVGRFALGTDYGQAFQITGTKGYHFLDFSTGPGLNYVFNPTDTGGVQYSFRFNSGSAGGMVIRNDGTTNTVLSFDSSERAIFFADIRAGGPVRLKSYTVATLPTGSAGEIAYASDLRAYDGAGVRQGAAAGTGGIVIKNGSAWKNADAQATTAAA